MRAALEAALPYLLPEPGAAETKASDPQWSDGPAREDGWSGAVTLSEQQAELDAQIELAKTNPRVNLRAALEAIGRIAAKREEAGAVQIIANAIVAIDRVVAPPAKVEAEPVGLLDVLELHEGAATYNKSTKRYEIAALRSRAKGEER